MRHVCIRGMRRPLTALFRAASALGGVSIAPCGEARLSKTVGRRTCGTSRVYERMKTDVDAAIYSLEPMACQYVPHAIGRFIGLVKQY